MARGSRAEEILEQIRRRRGEERRGEERRGERRLNGSERWRECREGEAGWLVTDLLSISAA